MANQVAVGIDISKRTMDVAIGHEQQSMAVFSNGDAGHQALITALKNYQVSLIVMEATGQYQLACACALQAARFAVVVINPRQARDFAKAMGRLAKTDSVDARMLAELAQVLNQRPDRDRFIKPMPDEAQQQLYALVLRRRQLVRLLVSERQRKHMAYAEVVQDIAELMDVLAEQLEMLDRRIAEHLAQYQSSGRIAQECQGDRPGDGGYADF